VSPAPPKTPAPAVSPELMASAAEVVRPTRASSPAPRKPAAKNCLDAHDENVPASNIVEVAATKAVTKVQSAKPEAPKEEPKVPQQSCLRRGAGAVAKVLALLLALVTLVGLVAGAATLQPGVRLARLSVLSVDIWPTVAHLKVLAQAAVADSRVLAQAAATRIQRIDISPMVAHVKVAVASLPSSAPVMAAAAASSALLVVGAVLALKRRRSAKAKDQ
jgi:hypothetical protein